MVVIVIIAIVYGVFVNKLHKPEKKVNQSFSLQNIASFLSTITFKKRVEIICLNPCQTCHVYSDGKQGSEIAIFKKEPEVLDFDNAGNLVPKEFGVLFDNKEPKKICFRFTRFANGSSSSYILNDEGIYYVYFPLMKPSVVTPSLSEAKEAFDYFKLIPTSTNEYKH